MFKGIPEFYQGKKYCFLFERGSWSTSRPCSIGYKPGFAQWPNLKAIRKGRQAKGPPYVLLSTSTKAGVKGSCVCQAEERAAGSTDPTLSMRGAGAWV